MSEALSSLRAPIDPGRGGVLLANMLASWLDHDRSLTATAEARDESQDSRTAPQQAGLHLPAPVERRAKFCTIGRVPSASMPCARRRGNWAGANP